MSRDLAGRVPSVPCRMLEATLLDWSIQCGSSMHAVKPVLPASQAVSSGARSDILIRASFSHPTQSSLASRNEPRTYRIFDESLTVCIFYATIHACQAIIFKPHPCGVPTSDDLDWCVPHRHRAPPTPNYPVKIMGARSSRTRIASQLSTRS